MKMNCAEVLTLATGVLLVDFEHYHARLLPLFLGRPIFTHEMGHAFQDALTPELTRQFPDLCKFGLEEMRDKVTTENWRDWLGAARIRFGDEFEVAPMADPPPLSFERLRGKDVTIVTR